MPIEEKTILKGKDECVAENRPTVFLPEVGFSTCLATYYPGNSAFTGHLSTTRKLDSLLSKINLPFFLQKTTESVYHLIKHLAIFIGYKGLSTQQLRIPENLKSNIQNTHQPFISSQIIKTSEEWT